VARLRAADAVILGKTNLSEWANIRSNASISGWSAVGGQTRNPHALDRNPCGSSAGSAAAVAAGEVEAAIGTETDGSITCPAAVNGVVGLKPTVGLVSRSRIVPISHSQDTAGPIAADVTTAARVLGAIAGADPADPATRDADAHITDYLAALKPDALKGARIGVLRFATGWSAATDKLFDQALAVLKAQGATLVDITALKDREKIGEAERLVLHTELKADLNAYLATTPPTVKTRTLADVIAFDAAHGDRELALFGQETFVKAEATKGLDDPAYQAARDIAADRRPRRDRRDAGSQPPRRARIADHAAGLEDRRGEWRSDRRRRRGQTTGGRGLSAPHRAHGRSHGAPGRPFDNRSSLERSAAARLRLCVRASG
jgi:amidase